MIFILLRKEKLRKIGENKVLTLSWMKRESLQGYIRVDSSAFYLVPYWLLLHNYGDLLNLHDESREFG